MSNKEYVLDKILNSEVSTYPWKHLIIKDFYRIKTLLEEKIEKFKYSSIEWRPINYIDLDKEKSDKLLEVLSSLEELDDVQSIFTNANLKSLQ